MTKDIEWLKKEFDEVLEFRKQSNPSSSWGMGSNTVLKYIKEDFKNLINQLDESEVVENLIVPKPELPVIPRYVDEFIRNNRDKGRSLYAALSWLENGHKGHMRAYEWYRRNELDFVNAYLTGKYTVEKEQKYYVIFKQEDTCTVTLNKNGGIGTIFRTGSEIPKSYQLTEEEIKGYDPRYMIFAKPVEELEE